MELLQVSSELNKISTLGMFLFDRMGLIDVDSTFTATKTGVQCTIFIA